MTDCVSRSPDGRWIEVRPGAVAGRVTVPASKSVSHRALNLALLTGREMVIENALEADDIRWFRGVLEALGWQVERVILDAQKVPGTFSDSSENAQKVPGTFAESHSLAWRLVPPEVPVDASDLYCGNAGTLFRFLTATATLIPGRHRIDGTPRLRERPIGPLVDALRQLGAEIHYLGEEGCAPLDICGESLRGGGAVLDAGESSQYLSALMMAGFVSPEPLRIEVADLTSEPYVEITRQVIRNWTEGDDPVHWKDGLIEVTAPRQALVGRSHFAVEGDWSAACYPIAAAILAARPGRDEVVVAGVSQGSPQGDRAFVDGLRRLGARFEWRGDELVVFGGSLTAIEADLSSTPDQVPTLAAMAPFARGTTRITNVPHLRIKESDRLAAMAEGLRRAGVPVEESADGLVIEGVWADGVGSPPTEPVEIQTFDDHRIAMAFALLGLRRPGLRILDPEVVAKSYPNFWRDFESLRVAAS